MRDEGRNTRPCLVHPSSLIPHPFLPIASPTCQVSFALPRRQHRGGEALTTMDDTFNDLPFPAKGIDRSQGFGTQPDGSTILGTNVRVFEPLTQRGRGGSRPGLRRYIGVSVPPSAVI